MASTGGARAPWWVPWAIGGLIVWQPALFVGAARATAEAVRYVAQEFQQEVDQQQGSTP